MYNDVEAAAARMGRLRRDAYSPDRERAEAYERPYQIYVRLHDHFGCEQRDLCESSRASPQTPDRVNPLSAEIE